MLHVSDWLPTLYRAAGGDPADLGNIDGIDQWESIAQEAPSKRTEVLYNYNPVETPGGAIRSVGN